MPPSDERFVKRNGNFFQRFFNNHFDTCCEWVSYRGDVFPRRKRASLGEDLAFTRLQSLFGREI